jgi:general secretion pathway protein H
VPGADPDLGVDFLSSKAGGGSSILVGGTLLETGALPHVSFYSDGTCSPFRVQFRSKGAAHVISIDPWTCAQTLVQGGGA